MVSDSVRRPRGNSRVGGRQGQSAFHSELTDGQTYEAKRGAEGGYLRPAASVPVSALAASTAVAGKPPADRGSASRALPAATMSEAIRGRDFFGAEGGGETKYEVSHVVGKGSYGIVWCELQRPGCARAMSSSSATAMSGSSAIAAIATAASQHHNSAP